MRLSIDTDLAMIEVHEGNHSERIPLYSRKALEILSEIWIKVQWNELNWRSFSWLGQPIWQLPDDLLRLQEVLIQIVPDVIVETGVNEGGSTLFFASLCELVGHGRVLSVDIQIPELVSRQVLAHRLSRRITFIEGNSVAAETIQAIRRQITAKERVFVFLDSDHSKDHVLAELEHYSPLVSVGSYIVACDGIMHDLADTPRGDPAWRFNNPMVAAQQFVEHHPKFLIERPKTKFNDECVIRAMTYWPGAWLKRIAE